MSVRVLVVEDFESNRELMVSGLGMRGYDVDGAGTIAEAEGYCARRDYDVIVMDYTLPDGYGDEGVRRIGERLRARGAEMPAVIAWTASNDSQIIEAWKRVRVFDVRIKADPGNEVEWLVDRIEGRPLVAAA